MITRRFPSSAFWKDRRVLVTGHTGFKGSWLTLWLHRLGANVSGLSLDPETAPNLFTLGRVEQFCHHRVTDIRDSHAVSQVIGAVQPEVVFHLAAQSLVRTSYAQPVETYATNVMGTAHILEALRGLSCVKVAVMVTTDKVYKNNEWLWPYRENDTLGGHDPYSASKSASELVIASYRDCFLASQGIAVASARAGNVIGGGDWSMDRLIPDAVRAWKAGEPLELRRPDAVRPWQHVLDPLCGYMLLAEHLWKEPISVGAYNFGPQSSGHVTVRQMIERAKDSFGQGNVVIHEEQQGVHEAGLLTLDSTKTQNVLGFTPCWSISMAIDKTMAWYRQQTRGVDALDLCLADLQDYEVQQC